MMRKDIPYSGLEHALIQMGVVPRDTGGKYRVLSHQPTDTLVVLPFYQEDENVRLPHLVGIRRVITERGVIEADDFDKLLAAV